MLRVNNSISLTDKIGMIPGIKEHKIKKRKINSKINTTLKNKKLAAGMESNFYSKTFTNKNEINEGSVKSHGSEETIEKLEFQKSILEKTLNNFRSNLSSLADKLNNKNKDIISIKKNIALIEDKNIIQTEEKNIKSRFLQKIFHQKKYQTSDINMEPNNSTQKEFLLRELIFNESNLLKIQEEIKNISSPMHDLQNEINKVKNKISNFYNSQTSKKSPPHINQVVKNLPSEKKLAFDRTSIQSHKGEIIIRDIASTLEAEPIDLNLENQMKEDHPDFFNSTPNQK